jgi:hypothetical protein
MRRPVSVKSDFVPSLILPELEAASAAILPYPLSPFVVPRTHGEPGAIRLRYPPVSLSGQLLSLGAGSRTYVERTRMGVQDAPRCRQSPWLAAGTERLVYGVAEGAH